jgi:hypothetical protein
VQGGGWFARFMQSADEELQIERDASIVSNPI